MTIQKYSGSEKPIFPGYEKVVVAIDKGCQLGITSGVIVDYSSGLVVSERSVTPNNG